MTYQIADTYIHRTEINYNDDFETTRTEGNHWQLEVYKYAQKLTANNPITTVVDFGCGAGFKLMKFFGNLDSTGIDLPQTVAQLNQKFPNRKWTSDINSVETVDLFISADAIEHMADPEVLIEFIKRIRPEHIVLSTPDRDLIPGQPYNGPPNNPYHIREWSFDEFRKYIAQHFTIIEHIITNKAQGTQMIYAKLKE